MTPIFAKNPRYKAIKRRSVRNRLEANQSRLRPAHAAADAHRRAAEGGLADDGATWQPARKNFLLPIQPLSKLFRTKFRDALRKADDFADVPAAVWKQDWQPADAPAPTPDADSNSSVTALPSTTSARTVRYPICGHVMPSPFRSPGQDSAHQPPRGVPDSQDLQRLLLSCTLR